MSVKALVFGYVALTHILLYATTPFYRSEVSRGLQGLATASWGSAAAAGSNSTTPRSGVYASSELLVAIQQHMVLPGSSGAARNSSSSSTRASTPDPSAVYSTGDTRLIAFMSATGILRGQGRKARAALFVYLLAPRYMLASGGRGLWSFAPELRLLSLAAAGLPAVGLLNRSEDSVTGYQLSCTSPQLSMGMGPQPMAQCSVSRWLTAPLTEAEGQVYDTCQSMQQVATWTILPDGTADSVAEQLREIGAASQPFLAGRSPAAAGDASGWIVSFLDLWLLFPRALLLQVVPALTWGPQQWLYGSAVLLFTFGDLLQLATSAASLHEAMATDGHLWDLSQWGRLMAALSVGLQLFLLTCLRTGLAKMLADFTLFGGSLMERGAAGAAQLLARQAAFHAAWRGQGRLAEARAAGAALLTLLAVLRLQDAGCLLLWTAVCVLLLGFVFTDLHEFRGWEEGRAAVTGVVLVWCTWCMGAVMYLCMCGPVAALPAGAATSRYWLTRLAARASDAVAASAAAAAASGKSSGSGGSYRVGPITAAIGRFAAATRDGVLSSKGENSSLLVFQADAAMLVAASLLWELLGPLGRFWWRGAAGVAAETGLVLECGFTCVLMAFSGVRLATCWDVFLAMVAGRLRQQAAAARRGAGAGAGWPHGGLGGFGIGPGGMQAQLVIHAPPAADVGHTAEALRALADELDAFQDGDDGGGGGGGVFGPVGLGGWAGQPRGVMVNGRLVLPRRNRGPKLGSHWPAPLTVEFDIDDVRDELGIEIPRGFICPLTLDIMRLPALLISSNIAVPSSYDKEAIARWLQDNRRDPKSRRVLASDAQLVPNFDLYRSIEDWVEHTQRQYTRHKQQQQQQAAAGAAAAAGPSSSRMLAPLAGFGLDGGAGGAGEGSGGGDFRVLRHRGLPANPAAAAAAGGAAAPRRRGRSSQQQPQSSGSLGSLLAAAGGAVSRGTAAAAVAAAGAAAGAARLGRVQPGRGVRQYYARMQAPATGGVHPWQRDLDDSGSEWDAEGEDGSGSEPWDEGFEGEDEGLEEGWDAEQQQQQQEGEEEEEEDGEAVDSHQRGRSGRGGSPPAAAAGGLWGEGGGGGTPGRYNLRQRRTPDGAA